MSYTLLLADDSVTTQRVLELTFAEHAVRVVGVGDGELALERLKSEPVHIVLADIGLAKISGYDLAARIRQEPTLASLPVLLLTGAFDTIDEARVRQSGAAGTLVKPLESGFVIKRVKELLGIPAAETIGTPHSRLVTPADASAGQTATKSDSETPLASHPVTAARDAGIPVPPPRDAHIPVPQAAWDQVREEKGLAPDTAPVEPAEGDDYFDRLDAAFDSLDAQLATTTTKPATRPTSSPAAAFPSAPDAAPVPSDADLAESMGLGNNWFDKTIAAEAERAAAPASVAPSEPEQPRAAVVTPASASARAEEPASYGETAPPPPQAPAPTPKPAPAEAPVPTHVANVGPPPPPAPVQADPFAGFGQPAPQNVTMVATASHVADAFESLLAAEQGEVELPQTPTIEISDDVIDRIAARVAEHLTGSVLIETVSRVAGTVTERLVREEIERIRSAAQSRKQ